MLQLILGPAGSGKTEYIYGEIQNRLDLDENTWILVPEQFSLFMEKELLQRFGLQAQTRVKVLSFSRLCNLVLSKIGPLRMKYIDGAGRQIIAAQVMEQLQGRLNVLGRNLRQKGFAQALVSVISEFKRYGVPPQALRFAAENTDMPEFAAKLEDLAVMYEAYNNLIEVQNSDAEDNLALICHRIGDCRFLSGKMYIMHFRSFTPIEYKAIGVLMHRMDICFSADYSDSAAFAGLFFPLEGTIRRLRETARTENTEELPSVILKGAQPRTALDYLRDRYFDNRAESYMGKTDNIYIYEVQNLYREIESAADLILRMCRTENRKFSDFLILARNTDSYSRILPAVFERRGIHVFLDAGRTAASKPMMRMLTGMIEILAYGPSYERVMRIARTGMFGLDNDSIDMLENYILAVAPTHAMWQADKWEYIPGSGDYDMERINKTKNTLLSEINQIKDEISGTKTGGRIADTILDWLKQSGLSERVSKIAEECLANGQPELSEEFQQVWNTAVSVLAQISKLMENTKMTYVQFLELFEDACDGIEIGLVPQTLDCVMFSQIDRFRSSGSAVVLVLGMNEGVFPKGYTTEGLITDNERRFMAGMGVEIAPGADSKRREEQLLIYAVFSAAKERLFFFRALEDNEGKPLQSSEILTRVAELFPNTEIINPDKDTDCLCSAEGAAAIFDRLTTVLAEYGGRADLMPLPIRELFQWFKQNDKYSKRLICLADAMSAKPPEKLSGEMVKKLYGTPLYLSASQLEAYNSCAFKYFLTYGLFARERERAGVEPRSMGSVQHAALYDYFTQIKSSGTDFDSIEKDDCFRMVGEAVENEAKKNAELLYEASAYYKYIVMRMKGIASRTAWEVIKFYRSSAFRPYGFEIKIGLNGDIPALSVRGRDGAEIAKIRGLIDRADTASVDGETLVSVIDYKSSAKGLDVELTEDGITLQPLLYTSALCSKIENAAPAAMVYMQMNDPIIAEGDYIKSGAEASFNEKMRPSGWIADDDNVISAYVQNEDKSMGNFVPSGNNALVSREELQKRLESANERIYESAAAIANGEIGIRPYRIKNKHDACAYCLFGGICQNEE